MKKPGRILAIVNQKGGVGKTTTAINLAASLAAVERKTLLVDMDPQSNATSGAGVTANPDKNIYHVILGEAAAQDAICKTPLDHLDVMAATPDLSGLEIEAIDLENREQRLRTALSPLRENYEFILIDCPPSLSLLTINALTAADSIFVPLQAEYFALEGLGRLMNTIDRIRESLNPGITVEGIVLTMFDKRNNLAKQVVSEVESHFPKHLYTTRIPRNIRIAEAPSFGKPILAYDIRSVGAQSYLALADEFLHRNHQLGVDHDRETSIGAGALLPNSEPPDHPASI